MFRYILVPACGAPGDGPAFVTALAVARRFAGHLHFLHVRLDVQMLLLTMASSDAGGAGIGGVADTLEQETEARYGRSHKAMLEFCRLADLPLTDSPLGRTPSASFRVQTGDELHLVAARARTADLTVVGRDDDSEGGTRALLEAVLLDSGRPVLIAPAQPPPAIGRRIAIAWKDTPEAARAVAAALPLLPDAEAVTVLSVEEDVATHDGGPPARLCQALQWHNPATRLRVIPTDGRNTAASLLAAAAETEADLLVMGGYSHSRMREAVFGGVTRHVLRSADLPVLMAH